MWLCSATACWSQRCLRSLSNSLGSHSASWPLLSLACHQPWFCTPWPVSAFSLQPIFPLGLQASFCLCQLDYLFLPSFIIKRTVGIVEAPFQSSCSYHLSCIYWLVASDYSSSTFQALLLFRAFVPTIFLPSYSLIFHHKSLVSDSIFPVKLMNVQVTPTDDSFQNQPLFSVWNCPTCGR